MVGLLRAPMRILGLFWGVRLWEQNNAPAGLTQVLLQTKGLMDLSLRERSGNQADLAEFCRSFAGRGQTLKGARA
jgi:hypothetical protein